MIKNPLASALLASALVFTPGPLHAGLFKVLKAFPATGLEGGQPVSVGAAIADGKIYGVTCKGGTGYRGVLYRMNLDGTGFEILHNFAYGKGTPGPTLDIASDGVGNLLYGPGDRIFGAKRRGNDYPVDETVWNFQLTPRLCSDLVATPGDEPMLSFIDSNMLYGFGESGDDNIARGTVFRATLDGENIETLHAFTGADGESVQQIINADGVIYGVTRRGGGLGMGTVFRLNKDGSEFRTLISFGGSNTQPSSIVYLRGKIYGISNNGGVPEATFGDRSPRGFLFALNTDGSGYEIIRTFADYSDQFGAPACIATDGDLLYITMEWGGPKNKRGGLISIRPDGTAQQKLVEFSDANNGFTGRRPISLVYSDIGGKRLYGANAEGGIGELGTVWSYDLGSAGDPAPYSGPLYGAVTFGGSLSTVQSLPFAPPTTSAGVTTTINAQKVATKPLGNAVVLERARQAGLQIPASGYSIVCTDVDGQISFYAYKSGSALVPLATLIRFADTRALQAVSTKDVFNSATLVTKSYINGTDKVHGEGVFLGKQVSMSRTVNYKSADAVINGQPSRYYPGTSKGVFFGLDEAGTEFVEGTFSIAAPTTIQVP